MGQKTQKQDFLSFRIVEVKRILKWECSTVLDGTNRVLKVKLKQCLGLGFHHPRTFLIMDRKQMVRNVEVRGQTALRIPTVPEPLLGEQALANFVMFFSWVIHSFNRLIECVFIILPPTEWIIRCV